MNKLPTCFHDFFLKEHRFDISSYDEVFLCNSLQTRMKAVKCRTIEEYCNFLQQSSEEGIALLRSLQISFSAFFRNSLTFAMIEHLLLPAAIADKNSGKEIRIWSAACAGGQEAYSLAILLEEHINCEKDDFCYRIFATDRDHEQIKLAKKGIYHADQLANLSLKYVRKWFTQNGDYYTVKPKLKKHLEFSVFDLFDEKYSSPPGSIFGDFKLIFCANLLFYYKAEYRKKIIDKMNCSLTEDGYLIVGETERDILKNYRFIEIFPKSGIFKNKIIDQKGHIEKT